MQLFKALGRVVISTLKYLSTNNSSPTESIARDFTVNLIDLPGLWTFLAAYHARISPRDFYRALDDHISADRMPQTSRPDQINPWLTALALNRQMASSTRPILPFTMYPVTIGSPIRFLVGPNQMPFDVHTSTLAAASPCFTPPSISNIEPPIALPSMTPEAFGVLTKWLYIGIPPTFAHDTDLQRLVELWVAACQLGLYPNANKLLRLGTALMTPSTRICDFDTARWVFAHTPTTSPLRGFIIAILAQRSQPDFASPFQHGDAAIWKARTAFMQKLQHVRKLLAFEARNADGAMVLDFEREKREIDALGVGSLPMPEFLVWGLNGWSKGRGMVPDRFFVFPGTEEFKEGLAESLKRK